MVAHRSLQWQSSLRLLGIWMAVALHFLGPDTATGAPEITTQPQSRTNLIGSVAAFTAAVTGTPPLVYQWQQGGVAITNNSRVSGADTLNLTIADVRLSDAGDFTLVVSDQFESVTSGVAVLTISLPEVVVFRDPQLETAIRTAINKPLDPIFPFDLATLTTFTACNLGISDLLGLEGATNLTSLCLDHNEIADVAMLEHLTNLIQLSMGDNRIADLQPLAGLVKLTSLNVGDNLITDFLPLAGLTNLSSLWLHANSPGSLAGLTNLSGLNYLTLYDCNLADIAPLGGLINLNYLELRYNPITNAGTVLGGLTNLHTLYLGGNTITNLNFLEHLPNLAFLNLSHNRITDLTPLTFVPNLRGVDLSYNPLTNIEALATFTNLTNLHLSGIAISNVAGLQTLSQLRSLTLYSNFIHDLAPLTTLTNLGDLVLSSNPGATYEDLAACTNLTSLWLEGNSLSQLGFVQGLRRLSALGISHNRLTDLANLDGLTNLLAVFADYNRLTNLSTLGNLPQLSQVQLVGNPLDVESAPTAALLQELAGRRVAVAYLPTNQPPTLELATNWFVAANQSSSLSFRLSDDITPEGQLQVSINTSNPDLLTNSAVLISGASAERTLTVTPAPNEAGTVIVTVTATDDAGASMAATVAIAVSVPQPVLIPDPTLEQALRSALYKTNGGLTSVDLLALTDLQLDHPALTNLSGLAWAENLMTLDISNSVLPNLDVLQNMPQLRTLRLNNCTIADPTAIGGLTNLNTLVLTGTSITNLSFLTNLSQLTDLVLTKSRLADIATLAGLTNLIYLDLHRNQLADIAPLTNLLGLAAVDLRMNLLETSTNAALQLLQDRGVEVAYVPQNAPPTVSVSPVWYVAINTPAAFNFVVSDDLTLSDQIQVVASTTNTDLILSASLQVTGTNSQRVLTLTPALDQTGTGSLTLTTTDDGGLSTNVEVLVAVITPQLVELEDPHLVAALRLQLGKPSGDLTDVDFLSLTKLTLDEPLITNLAGLERATNLTTLKLNATSVTNLDRLQDLGHLTSLNLANSRLHDLTPLTALTNLQFLGLYQNRLSDISPLTNFPSLVNLDLRLNLLNPSSNSVLNYFQDRGIAALFQPQRMAPMVTFPERGFGPANANSFFPFSALNDGPSEEQLSMILTTDTGSWSPDVNLFAARDVYGSVEDWRLTVVPPTNFSGTCIITLLASNEVSLVTTSTMTLTISPPLPLNNQVLGGPDGIWLSGGAAPWFGQTNTFLTGGAGAQSGGLLDNQESWLATSVAGPGILSFWWKISSEVESDWLELYLNDHPQGARIAGETDWERVEITLSPGPQAIKWRYFKDGSLSRGTDTAWIDNFAYTQLSWLELVGVSPDGQFQLQLHPVLDRQYVLETSTDLSTWIPLAFMTGIVPSLAFQDPMGSSTRFYRLREWFTGPIWLENARRLGDEFQVELHSSPGLRFEMQSSTNLVSWDALTIVTNTLGTVQYSQTEPADSPLRFYRARLLP